MRKQLLDELQDFYKPGDAEERLSNLIGFLRRVIVDDTGCNEEEATDLANMLGSAASGDKSQILLFETILPTLPEDLGLRRIYREAFLTMLQGRVDHYSRLAGKAERDVPDEDRCWPCLVDAKTTDGTVSEYER